MFYYSQASFDAAAPGLPVDMFSGTGIRPSPYSNMAGLSITTLHPGMTSNALILSGDGIGTNWFGDTLILNFAPGVTAFGTTLFANANPGQGTFAGDFTVDVYNGSTDLGSTSTHEAAGGTAYIGATSTIPITSVNILFNYDSDAVTYASNVAFSPSSVPEPGSMTLAMTALAAAFAGLRMAARYRR